MSADLPKADTGMLLIHALRQMAAAIGCLVRTESIAATPWASATFTGTRYRIVMAGTPCPSLAAWLDGLPEAEFALPGHLVADFVVSDLAMAGAAALATFDILTLVDA